MHAQFGIHQTRKKDQIHRTGTEKSSKICAQQLHRPNTRLCHKYVKIIKMGKTLKIDGNEQDCMLFKIQHELIDIDIGNNI